MCAGYLVFNGVAGKLFDKQGPCSPWVVVGLLDLALVIYTMICHYQGHLFNGKSADDAQSSQ